MKIFTFHISGKKPCVQIIYRLCYLNFNNEQTSQLNMSNSEQWGVSVTPLQSSGTIMKEEAERPGAKLASEQ